MTKDDPVRELIELVAKEYGARPGDTCADAPDDEAVSSSMRDGKVVRNDITFGHIRRAMAVLATTPAPPQDEPTPWREEDIDVQAYRRADEDVNVPGTCVRVIHRPTGYGAASEAHRSLEENRREALRMLAIIVGDDVGRVATPRQDGREGEDEPVAWQFKLLDGRRHPLASPSKWHVISAGDLSFVRDNPYFETRPLYTRPASAAQPSVPAVQGEDPNLPQTQASIVQCIHDSSNDQFVPITSYRGVELCTRFGVPYPAPPDTTSPVAGDAVAITDEMVDVALDEWHPGKNWRNFGEMSVAGARRHMRAALEAALRASSKGER